MIGTSMQRCIFPKPKSWPTSRLKPKRLVKRRRLLSITCTHIKRRRVDIDLTMLQTQLGRIQNLTLSRATI